jgi:hypothetical protein
MSKAQDGTGHAIVKLESYEGRDTFVHCGDSEQDYLYLVVAVYVDGTAEIVDSSYRTAKEANEAWPEAVPVRE